MTDFSKLRPRSKLWIADEKGRTLFGGGRLSILEAIDRFGSMNRAAAELGMSFRTLWGRIRDTERLLGIRLVENRGRNRTGGSMLTPEARELLRLFSEFQVRAHEALDKAFRDIFS